MAKAIARDITILMSSFQLGIVSKTYAERNFGNGRTPYLRTTSCMDMPSTNELSGWNNGSPKPRSRPFSHHRQHGLPPRRIPQGPWKEAVRAQSDGDGGGRDSGNLKEKVKQCMMHNSGKLKVGVQKRCLPRAEGTPQFPLAVIR